MMMWMSPPSWKIQATLAVVGCFSVAIMFVISQHKLLIIPSKLIRRGLSEGVKSGRMIEEETEGRIIEEMNRRRLSEVLKRIYPASEFTIDEDGHQVIKGSWIPSTEFGTQVYNHSSGYVIENRALCNAPKIILFVFVESAPTHFQKRRTWREMWANLTHYHGYDVVKAFVIGRSHRERINAFVREESGLFSDIIQLDYLDVYANLTRKTMTSLDWVLRNCRHTAFVLKTDDDVMIFGRKFVNHLISIRHVQGIYAGLLMREVRVYRSGSWAVGYDQYPFEVYPDYNVGMSILFSMDALQRIVKASRHVIYNPVEDAFLGIAAKAAGVRPLSYPGFTIVSDEETEESQLATLIDWLLDSEGMAIHGLRKAVWQRLIDRVIVNQTAAFHTYMYPR